jgi:hypothetical protein
MAEIPEWVEAHGVGPSIKVIIIKTWEVSMQEILQEITEIWESMATMEAINLLWISTKTPKTPLLILQRATLAAITNLKRLQ